MAEKCAHCGRADLLQALVRGWQCLACGKTTDENLNPIVPQAQGPDLTNAGLPVKELSEPAPVVLAPVVVDIHAVEPEPVVRPFEVADSRVASSEPPPVLGVSDVSGAPSDIDYASLTTEQVAEIERIAHGQ
jgi:hypothetical protein